MIHQEYCRCNVSSSHIELLALGICKCYQKGRPREVMGYAILYLSLAN